MKNLTVNKRSGHFEGYWVDLTSEDLTIRELPFNLSSVDNKIPTYICSYKNDAISWYADGSQVKAMMNRSITPSNVITHCWYIYEVISQGTKKYKVQSALNDKYITVSPTQPDGYTDGLVTLVDESSATLFDLDVITGTFRFGGGKYLSVKSEDSATVNQQVQNVGVCLDAGFKGCTNSFPLPQVTVSIPNGVGTLYLPFGVEIPESTGIEANAGIITDNQVHLVKYNYIPKFTGAVIRGSNGVSASLKMSTKPLKWDKNDLRGVCVDTLIPVEETLVLGPGPEGKVGFYQGKPKYDKDGNPGTTHFKLGAGKAYCQYITSTK